MKILYIILISLVCFNVKAEPFKCVKVEDTNVFTTISRCENSKAICYYIKTYNESGFNCKFKQ